MTRTILTVAAGALVLVALAGQVSAGPIITVDENGNGTIDGQPLQSFVGPDPGPGGSATALTYVLPGNPTLNPGDVFLSDSPGTLGDLIRFNPVGRGGQQFASLVFYSDSIPNDSLADTGLPSGRYD